ncbi:MAG: hypothetical protein WC708_00775 [Lentisphaeria bacterium]|jgi:hypothetical protein
MNVPSSITCALCKRQKKESLIPKIRIVQKSDPEIMMERVSQTEIEFQDLQTRLEAARKKLEEKNSLPPTGAIRLIVPNNWTGIVITAVVVIAVVTLIVLVKSFAK